MSYRHGTKAVVKVRSNGMRTRSNGSNFKRKYNPTRATELIGKILSNFKFLNDVENKTVYKMPCEPAITEQKDGHGKRIGWHVPMEILITCADNVLRKQWMNPIRDNPVDHYDPRYNRVEVASEFLTSNEPSGVSISEAEYEELRAVYDAAARRNEG